MIQLQTRYRCYRYIDVQAMDTLYSVMYTWKYRGLPASFENCSTERLNANYRIEVVDNKEQNNHASQPWKQDYSGTSNITVSTFQPEDSVR